MTTDELLQQAWRQWRAEHPDTGQVDPVHVFVSHAEHVAYETVSAGQ
jgi:hypothetical protein